jgi:hypothetical protein
MGLEVSGAGWSSLAARRAHNPKVAGSNPAPATNSVPELFCVCSLKIQTIDEGGYWVARYLADAGDAWILGDWGLGVVRVGGELKLSRSTCLEANSNR